ncbi:hypothetical protein MNL06_06440 [Bartonella krasnovii]|uniref:hypothetical protein n=1 Tax=Bartonella krasnovii TaxID=2267275 RepID=UPI001F4CD51A|nr:hypothetical protein [Bartonella krasnovii]UNF45184.1 hypothetical protein MNL06_06440 [Bartonella krasnovii]
MDSYKTISLNILTLLCFYAIYGSMSRGWCVVRGWYRNAGLVRGAGVGAWCGGWCVVRGWCVMRVGAVLFPNSHALDKAHTLYFYSYTFLRFYKFT